jgi:Ni,Fe-hydrogenase maturation factor
MKTSFEAEQLQPFKTLEEEVAFLRKEIRERDKQFAEEPGRTTTAAERLNEATRSVAKEYHKLPTSETIDAARILPDHIVESIVLNLPPEPHDETMGELLGIMQKEGIKNALAVVERLGNHHVTDDFH